MFYYTIILNEGIQLQGASNTLHTRAQKLLIASEGKPLLLSAVKVKSLGSSQSLQINEENKKKKSQFKLFSISVIYLITLHIYIQLFNYLGFTYNYLEKKIN